MADDDDGTPAWPPAMFSGGTGASGEAIERQMELFKRFMSMGTGAGSLDGPAGLAGLGSMGTGAAVFKTRVQSGGRISIPDAEREALDIDEGDIVQTVVIPINNE